MRQLRGGRPPFCGCTAITIHTHLCFGGVLPVPNGCDALAISRQVALVADRLVQALLLTGHVEGASADT